MSFLFVLLASFEKAREMGEKSNRRNQNERRISESVYTRSCLYVLWCKIGRASRKSFAKIKLPGKCFRADVEEDGVRGGGATERTKLRVAKNEFRRFGSIADDATAEELTRLVKDNDGESREMLDRATETSLARSSDRAGLKRFREFESVNSSDLHTILLDDSVTGSSS